MSAFAFVRASLAVACVTACAQPLFQVRDIFPLVPEHVHASSIVETPQGDLLACWFQGSGERTADDVVINGARLTRGAAQWSPVFPMADTPGFPDCNPVLDVDRHGRLWLYWIPVLAHRWECCYLKYRRAEDYEGDGPPRWSWQDEIILKPGEEFAQTIEAKFDEIGFGEGMWGEYALPYRRLLLEAAQDPYKRQTGWMTRIHPLTLPSGRILLPLYSDGFNLSLVAISDDDGDTWRASGPIVGLGPTQPTLVPKRDGTIVAYNRDSGEPPYRVQISTSTDNGESWSATKDLDIPNPDSSLEVIVLDNGDWLMICNDTEDERYRLTAMVSDDEGDTWRWKRQIEPCDAEGKTFGYPSVIQSRDGLIHMTYSRTTATGKTIRHTTIDTAWLKAQP